MAKNWRLYLAIGGILLVVGAVSCKEKVKPLPKPIVPIEGNWKWLSTGSDIAPFYRETLGYFPESSRPDTIIAEYKPGGYYWMRLKYYNPRKQQWDTIRWEGNYQTSEDPFKMSDIRVIEKQQWFPVPAQVKGIYQAFEGAEVDSLLLEVVQVTDSPNRPPTPSLGFGSANFHIKNPLNEKEPLFGRKMVQKFIKIKE
jgi:hypothetical protein